MRTPEVEIAIANQQAYNAMYVAQQLEKKVAELEALDEQTTNQAKEYLARAEAAEADSARHKRNEELQMERAIKAEARVKELEREAADSAEEWAFCGLGVGSAAAAAMKHMEILKKYREQSARLRAALESLQSDAQCTIDLYNKIGPTWTSRDSGAEYYDASYVIGSAEERIATIKAALADTKGTT